MVSGSNNHDTCWYDVSTRYFYVLFFSAIAITDFHPLQIYENKAVPCLLSLLQSTTTQISINIFVSNIIQYEISLFIKICVMVFYVQIWFKCETSLLFFLIRTMVYRKKLVLDKNIYFFINYGKIIELHVLHTWCHMKN